ncbi:unnamed protein product, partial [Chrysoparadoxa australica]
QGSAAVPKRLLWEALTSFSPLHPSLQTKVSAHRSPLRRALLLSSQMDWGVLDWGVLQRPINPGDKVCRSYLELLGNGPPYASRPLPQHYHEPERDSYPAGFFPKDDDR